jgi:hypothetical protein
MTDSTAAIPSHPPAPTPIAGIGVAFVVVIAIVGWVMVGTTFLSEASIFGGFLIFLYWAKFEHLNPRRLPNAILGALVGIGISWVTFYGETYYGGAGFAVGMALLVLAIYLDIIEAAPLVVNTSTMFFSIITAAPLVKLEVNWIELCTATVGGGLFFGGFLSVVMWVGTKVAKITKVEVK